MTSSETQALTDGFHLVIDALKLNGIKTITVFLAFLLPILGGLRKPRACG